MNQRALCWIRRDLRLHDHHALSKALKESKVTYVVFIFDENILKKLKNKEDKRITFIIESLLEIERRLNSYGTSLIIKYGTPEVELKKLANNLKIDALYFNRDYEPYAKKRDLKVTTSLTKIGIRVLDFKDHVFYEKNEILTGTNQVYKVFTPYKNKWLEKFQRHEKVIPNYKCNLKKLAPMKTTESILNENWFQKTGFIKTSISLKAGSLNAIKQLNKFKNNVANYKEARDIPSLNQTSNISTYIRMGNISIRDLIRLSIDKENIGSKTWLSELIWREFYQVILDTYPHVEQHCFKEKYDKLKWSGTKKHFELWCKGLTGFPIIDAAMRCLNQTGLMHNRLRMVVASFLTKTLLVDWKLGERYFSQKLLDYDMAANNGGWQWSASTGVDAQPYFRIFNPYNQSEKFDHDGIFIRKWCPELKHFSNKQIHYPHESELIDQMNAKCFIGKDYPHPIVSYKGQKEKALTMFKAIK